MTWRSAITVALGLACGCGDASGGALVMKLRVPAEAAPAAVDTYLLSVRDGRGGTVVVRRFDAAARALRIDDVPFATGLSFGLDGLFRESTIAQGRSCPIDVLDGRPLPTLSLLFATTGSFSATLAPPTARRVAPVAFVRTDGSLVVAGGADATGGALGGSDSYNPRTGVWATEPALKVPRHHAAVATFGDGDALVVGGIGDGNQAVSVAETYRQAEGFQALPVDPGLLGAGLRATTLADDRVLVTGGGLPGGPAAPTALIFDGVDFRSAGPMNAARRDHTASAVGTGSFSAAFIIGGSGGTPAAPLASIELFNPRAGAGSQFAFEAASLLEARSGHTATVLRTGEILVVGGSGAAGVLATAELFDPVTRTVRAAGRLDRARRGHAATLLHDGRVLITGGTDAAGLPTTGAELYDPPTATFVAARPMGETRSEHAAVGLCDGTVLLVGSGEGAEVYSPVR